MRGISSPNVFNNLLVRGDREPGYASPSKPSFHDLMTMWPCLEECRKNFGAVSIQL